MSKAPDVGSSAVGINCKPGYMQEFPAGLRVLVVDDDWSILKILKLMLTKCKYDVTTCSQATIALSILHENKGGFDVVLTDLHMPHMNGIELLQLVGSEMDLPVVVMSADDRPSVMMTGIINGACGYLLKPLHMDVLRNIWQHAFRKKQEANNEHPCNFLEAGYNEQATHRVNHGTSLSNELIITSNSQRKKRHVDKYDFVDPETEDSSSKKKRLAWTTELHQKFVNAINQIGIDKAGPQKILGVMNVPGVTKCHVSSHLQKYRLKVKSIGETAQQLGVISHPLFGAQQNARVGFLARPNFPTSWTAFPAKTHDALPQNHLGQPSDGFFVHQPVHWQASAQGPNNISVGHAGVFTQSQTNVHMSKQFPESGLYMPSLFSTFPTNNLGTASSMCSLGGASSSQNRSMLVQQGPAVPLAESRPAMSTQPHQAFPSQASDNFMSQNSTSMNHNPAVSPYQSSDNDNVASQSQSIFLVGDDQLASHSNNMSHSNNVPSNTGQHLDEGFNDIDVLNRGLNWSVHTPDFNVGQPSYSQDSGMVVGTLINQGQGSNIGSEDLFFDFTSDDENAVDLYFDFSDTLNQEY